MSLPFTPLIILGAPRSGTNALRDALTALPGLATWPCDEINPIWRHGNLATPHDALVPEQATARVREFIRGAFHRIWRAEGKPAIVVEKTCANTLRVPFIAAILPEARYIHITRNGVDVTASAAKRWQGQLEVPGLPYYLAKIRYAPMLDLPVYGWSFLKARLGLLLGGQKRLSVWGPRWPGMEDHAHAPLEELCAHQWAACVTSATAALSHIDPTHIYTLSYEDFTANPSQTLSDILAFLGHSVPEAAVQSAGLGVHGSSVGKGSGQDLAAATMAVLRPVLDAHGYKD